jgi:hypothetical protein
MTNFLASPVTAAIAASPHNLTAASAGPAPLAAFDIAATANVTEPTSLRTGSSLREAAEQESPLDSSTNGNMRRTTSSAPGNSLSAIIARFILISYIDLTANHQSQSVNVRRAITEEIVREIMRKLVWHDLAEKTLSDFASSGVLNSVVRDAGMHHLVLTVMGS